MARACVAARALPDDACVAAITAASHAARRSERAGAWWRRNSARAVQALLNELVGVPEVRGQQPREGRRGQHGEVHAPAAAGDVLLQAPRDRPRDRRYARTHGAARRLSALRRSHGGEDEDAVGAELDGVCDRRVVDDPTVHEEPALPSDRRDTPGTCATPPSISPAASSRR
jgi:hypothetical protein